VLFPAHDVRDDQCKRRSPGEGLEQNRFGFSVHYDVRVYFGDPIKRRMQMPQAEKERIESR
jgi:hypothetical protein